jgi:integrase
MPQQDGLHKRRGIWCYRLRVDGKLKELSTRTRNYQEARKVRQEAIEAQRNGQLPTDLAKAPFNKVAEEWLAGRKLTVGPMTWASDRQKSKPLLRAFAGRRLEELTANGGALLRAYQLQRAKSVGPRSINMELTVVRLILKSARLWKQIADDVRPLREPKGGPGRALTADEESRLWTSAASRSEWSVAYWAGLLAANTTCRGCEVKRLRLGDVDLGGVEEGQVFIRKSKTDGSTRNIPLNPTARWALDQLLARAYRLGSQLPDDYLLPRRVNTDTYDVTRHQVSFRSAWRKLTRAAGLRGLRFHDLRHHAITRLAESPDVSEGTIMAIAGHLSPQMVAHYSHVRQLAKREAVSRLSSPVVLPLASRAPAVVQ